MIEKDQVNLSFLWRLKNEQYDAICANFKNKQLMYFYTINGYKDAKILGKVHNYYWEWHVTIVGECLIYL